MKRVAFIVLSMLLITLTACGAKEAAVPNGGPDVSVTIPREVLGVVDDADIQAQAKEQNVRVAIDHDADTLTYTMSEKQHEELLLSYKTEFEQNLLTAQDEGKMPGLVDVSYDEDMANFELTVVRSQYAAAEERFDFGFFYSYGITYQLFAGRPSDEVDVILHFFDEGANVPFEEKSMIEAFNDARNADDGNVGNY